MEHRAWLEAASGGRSQRSIATKAGVQQSKISRQLKAGRLDPEMVIDLARACEVSPVDALVETGYLRESDGQIIGLAKALENATNQQLLDEVLRRSGPTAKLLLRGGDGTITPKGKRVVPDKPEPRLREHGGRLKRNVDDINDGAGQ